jgi:hypothetical protein
VEAESGCALNGGAANLRKRYWQPYEFRGVKMTLDNLELFAVPLENYIAKWIFKDQDGVPASPEHSDQIFALSNDAAEFLWKHETQLHVACTEKYFKNIATFDSNGKDQKAIKKYLFDLGVPFSQKVFIAMQPHIGFVLTWKMAIKYSHNIFRYDQRIYDKSSNWMLEYHHDGVFKFGRDFIFDGEAETLRNKQVINEIKKQLADKKKL